MSSLVIGASRGIGKQIAKTFANAGYSVGIAAKTVDNTDLRLPGTIFDVAQEIHSNGGQAIPIQCNVRNVEEVDNAVTTCISQFGFLDVVIYNAGAIMWDTVINTPMKKFNLMMDVNIRGAYALTQSVLPYFLKQNSGKIIMVSPPIYSRFFRGKTPYAISKVGMSVLVQGLSNELIGSGVSITSLWPATAIKSHVTDAFDIPSSMMRKADIFADACLAIAKDTSSRINGECLIDEDYLRSIGVENFKKYRCDPNVEPKRMMPHNFPSLLVDEQDDRNLEFDHKKQ